MATSIVSDGPAQQARSTASLRPEIQALRAIGVVLMITDHAFAWLPGAFISVDIIFVASGFLITGQLVSEVRASGRISLSAFYARRIRRLLPAATLVTIVTLGLVWMFLPPLSRGPVTEDAIAVTFLVSNMWFAFEGTNYLADHTPSPFEHDWTLSMNEQFCLLLPALLLLGVALTRRKRNTAVVVVLAALAVTSFALCVWLTGVDQPWAFFGLPTRAWEFAVGGLLAVSTAHRSVLPPSVLHLLGWAGLVLLALLLFALHRDDPFPGWLAALPVLASGLIIVSGENRGASTWSPLRLLGIRPIQFVGDVSYSWYLWHLPLLVIPAVAFGGDLHTVTKVALVALSFLLAVATYHWVETPVRRAPFLIRRTGANFGMAAALVSLAVVTALGVAQLPRLSTGAVVGAPTAQEVLAAPPLPTHVPPDVTPALDQAFNDNPASYADGCLVEFTDVSVPQCTYGNPGAAVTVVMFGDSHAAQFFPAMLALADANNWRLITMTKARCPAADVLVDNPVLGRPFTECRTWNTAALERIRQLRPALVVIGNYSVGFAGSGASGLLTYEEWGAGLARTITAIPATTKVAILGGTPEWRKLQPTPCLSAELDDPQACSAAPADVIDMRMYALEHDVATRADATFIDTLPWLCQARCQTLGWNMVMYRDQDHLTATFARALSGRMAAALHPVLAR